jgi:hypothetical protein
MKITCVICQNVFDVYGCRKHTAKFCSVKCKAEYQRLYNHGENHPRWTEAERVKTCQYCGKEFKQGKTEAISSFTKRKFCSHDCGWLGQIYFSGEDNVNWTGGKRQRDYRHVRWADSVIRRDKATCQKCGATSVEMQAHHLRSYIDHQELRYDINNGMTLCYACHWKEHGLPLKNVSAENIVNSVIKGSPAQEIGTNSDKIKTINGRAYRRWEGKCDCCGAFLSIQLSKAKDKDYHFCDKKCMGKYYSVHRTGIVKEDKQWEGKCDFCEKPLIKLLSKANQSIHHFCNKKCFGKYYSLHRTGVKQIDKQWEGKCDYCGVQITRPLNKAKRTTHHFCDRTCFGKYTSGGAKQLSEE